MEERNEHNAFQAIFNLFKFNKVFIVYYAYVVACFQSCI